MNRHLAKIIDSVQEGIYVTDRDRRFLLWNEAAERISGYSRNEMIGLCCQDNILKHVDRKGIQLCRERCPLKSSIDDGVFHGPVVVYLQHKDGRRIAVEVKTAPFRDDDGTIIGGVEIFQDVTERIERESLLKEGKKKLETVLDNIGDGILFLDTIGTMTMFNSACAEMFGLEAQAMGSPVHSLSVRSPLRTVLSAVERLYRQSLNGNSCAVTAQCEGGRTRFRCWSSGTEHTTAPFMGRGRCNGCETFQSIRSFLEKPHEVIMGDRSFSVVSSFIEMPDTNDIWEVIMFYDVTAEKLDAALKVAGAAAHELRQPLQTIVILAGLIEKSSTNHGSLEKISNSIMKSCDRMDDIIKKMCEISRYRTKDYIDGFRILDLEHSSKKKHSG
ncbi:MAG TPA: PAS domain S-box protein [Nitrospirota bacterium]|nr:PAS domain S-box protein [Nitrospirota bacterium]